MALIAVSIQSIFSLLYYRGLDRSAQENLESLSEHSATIHMNAMFVFLLAVYLFKCSAGLRWVATVCVIPVFYAYALSQRRAAMVALFIGIVVLVRRAVLPAASGLLVLRADRHRSSPSATSSRRGTPVAPPGCRPRP